MRNRREVMLGVTLPGIGALAGSALASPANGMSPSQNFQAAISSGSSDQSAVPVPRGMTLINSTVLLPHTEGLSVLGEGRSFSTLKSATRAPVFSQEVNGRNYNDGRIEDLTIDISAPEVGSAFEFADTSARMSDWNFRRVHIKGNRHGVNANSYGLKIDSNLVRARFEDCRIDFVDIGAEFSNRRGGQIIFDRLGIYSCRRGLRLANAGNNFVRLLTGDSVSSDFLVLESGFNVVEAVSCEQKGYAEGPLLVIDGANFNEIRRAMFSSPRNSGGTVAAFTGGSSGNFLEIFLRQGKVELESATSANEVIAYIPDGDVDSDVVDSGTNNKIIKRFTRGIAGPVVREWQNWK
jgi:hypothetical protein